MKNELSTIETSLIDPFSSSFRSIYQLECLTRKGEQFRYSDVGLVIDFPVRGHSKGADEQEYFSRHFSPTQYVILKRLLLDLGEVVPFAELVAVLQPASSLDQAMIRQLSKHISFAKKKLPPTMTIRNLYTVGYTLDLLRI